MEVSDCREGCSFVDVLYEGVALAPTSVIVELDPEALVRDVHGQGARWTHSTFETGPTSENTLASCSSETSLQSRQLLAVVHRCPDWIRACLGEESQHTMEYWRLDKG